MGYELFLLFMYIPIGMMNWYSYKINSFSYEANRIFSSIKNSFNLSSVSLKVLVNEQDSIFLQLVSVKTYPVFFFN